MLHNMDILCLSVSDWDSIKQRPQHLAMELAKSNRVLYINPVYSLFTYLRHMKEKNRRINLTKEGKNLYILTCPPLLPLSERYLFIEKINYLIAFLLIKHSIRRLKLNYSVIWVNFPRLVRLAEKFSCNSIVWYDCMDNHSLFYPINSRGRKLIEKTEEELFQIADIISASSGELVFKCKKGSV